MSSSMKLRKIVEETAIEVCRRHSHAQITELHILRALLSKVGTQGTEHTIKSVDKELDKIPVVRNAPLSISQGATSILNELELRDPIEVRDAVIDFIFNPQEPDDQDPDNSLDEIDNLKNDVPKKPVQPKKPPVKVNKTKIGKSESLDDVLAELNQLIGLEKAKAQVNSLIALHRANTVLAQQNRSAVPVGLHLVFTGNPGTGKTTVARLIGRLYKAIGLLDGGQLIEVDRSQLVAGYVGQTAIRTQEAINSADGGVLFIDEAYSLSGDSGSDSGFGSEAISTLVKAMEDKRDTLAVVVAGYSEDMKEFIKSNQGLKSRFQTFIEFEDYGTEELIKIFKLISSSTPVAITSEVEQALREYITGFKPSGEDGNGRFARNLFEKMFLNLTTRAMADGTIDPQELEAFSVADVPQVPQKNPDNPDKPRIGFV